MRTAHEISGGNLLGRWQREFSATDSLTLQAYIDGTKRDWPARIRETRTTYDVDFQYRTQRHAGHDLVGGLSYRTSSDSMTTSFTGLPPSVLPYLILGQDATRQRWVSAFLQDDIVLAPKRLILTLGGKLEKSDTRASEFQPNARLLWAPDDTTTVWGSAARAARTPARIDSGGILNQAVLAPGHPDNPTPLPLLARIIGANSSESLTAYELGIKHRVDARLSIDLAVFQNEYRDLRSGRTLAAYCLPSAAPAPFCLFRTPSPTLLVVDTTVSNEAAARSRGLELAIDWRPLPNLRVQPAVTYLSMKVAEPDGIFSADRDGSAPTRQASVRVTWNPRADIDLDLWWRHEGTLEEPGDGPRNPGSTTIPGYAEIDLHVAWRPIPRLELELVGRNLLHRSHREFISELGDVPSMAVRRSWFGKLTWRF